MAKKFDPTLKAVLIGAAIAVAPFLGMAYYAGAQAAAFTPRTEPGGFRWRGLTGAVKLTKVAELPNNTCTIYRVDTEGQRLYVTSSGAYSSCSLTNVSSDQE
ncbi:hypothetical protein HOU02_gp258 [Caulobacter phage CcrBL9]|uniref:Uncharacterized protein n=1 Tax=Caulobacter phage CcrBL9 TaxID=2283270 RepID=A0A385EFA4_9CAUD|nr:hypothetical protein HOU02_gp258 [Caulobacter phage CcrBL9]AXQ69467.1 hypothetical protein CcrBL9_gp443 [Caulobacter phage CcrBL9]